MRLPIDHIGILGASVDSLVEEFEALGFHVVGPAELTAVDAAGRRHELGQRSAHVMFANNYVELTAVSSTAPDHHLAAFLKPPWGIRLLILASDDIDRSHADCADAGLSPGPIQQAGRNIAYGAPGEARFRWFGLPIEHCADALVAFVQHLTPDTVFQSAVSEHDNRAVGLTGLFYAGTRAPAAIAKLATPAGQTFDCIGGTTPEPWFPASDTTPIAAAAFAVDDMAATERYFHERGIPFAKTARGLVVRLESGVCLVFRQRAR